jgi:tetratricopeptide (TPR) repeat protein
MLDFLEQLERVRDVPLLLVGTTRPGLFDTRPGWAADAPAASVLTLAPLSQDDMNELLTELLVRSVVPVETRAPLLESAGGNPLYALEFVRMLGDRDVVSDTSAIALPETIQALIAARLDALTPAQRSLLHDAAVVGDPFWSGALASMATGDANVDEAIVGLQRRDLIERTASPTMEGEDEFAFSHALIRDVAYRQIPRAGRAERHMAVARWLEENAGDRLVDRAELLAHHTTEALSLARAANLSDEIPAIEANARRFLILAGDRQSSLDFGQAAAFYRRALELTPAGNLERSEVLRKATEVGWRSGDMDVDSAIRAYEEVVEIALAAGDRQQAALGRRRLYFQLGFRGNGEAARNALDRAVELLEGEEPTPVLAELYASLAEDEMLAGGSDESLRWADRALELPHNDATEIMALHIRGNGRCELGDMDGMEDLRESLRLAEASGVGLHIATSYSYLAEWVGLSEGPERGLALNDASVEVCDRRGIQGQAMWARAESMWLLYDAGRWDEILDRAPQIVTWGREHGDTIVESIGIAYRARVLARRGIARGTEDVFDRGIPIAHQSGDLQIQTPVLVTAAIVEQLRGNGDAALGHIRELEEATREGPTEYRELQAPAVLRICLANGEVQLATEVLGDRHVFVTATQDAVLTARALLAEARHDLEGAAALFEESAAAWETYGDPFERAHALLGLSRCSVSPGRSNPAAVASAEAKRLFATLGVPS